MSIARGQYVRAVMADGIGAGLPLADIAHDEQYRHGGIVVGFDRPTGTVKVVDALGNLRLCWEQEAEVVDPLTLNDAIRDWALGKQVELGSVRAGAVP